MDNLDDLSTVWRSQPVPATPHPPDTLRNLADRQMKKIRRGHVLSLGILGATVVVLVAILILSVRADLAFGISLMAGSLGVRMAIEYYSLRDINGIRQDLSMVDFRERLTKHHKRRAGINTIYTPVLYLAYCVGFVLLLPSFRETLPPANYTLVWSSGATTLLAFAFFLFYTLKREKKVYRHLLNLTQHDNH